MANDNELVEELRTIAERLDGTFQRLTTFDSTGRQSKKVVIEYDIRNKES
jgi:hypothetical protein|tara:strand:+ start:266 stop:415 length:150 start_codon:yes stop_codon:yes gene_type:complete